MMTPTASAFSDAAWLCAVLAHVPQATPVVPAAGHGPFGPLATHKVAFPIPHLESATTALTPCALPAVSHTPTTAEAEHFLDTLGVPLVLRGVPSDNPLTVALLKAAARVATLKTWSRAALDLTGDFESWMAGNFDHKRRKELKRLKARLAEQGTLVLEELGPNGDLAPHIAAFLAVEASGWKGERGTAILSNENAARGLAAGLAAMHEKGNVRFWTLRLDGKPVASLFALINGSDAVLGKIGFDQSFARFSPGVLLIIEATRCLFAEKGLTLADSNAIPGHPMIDRIWRDRINCMDVVVAGVRVGSVPFTAVARFHGTKDAVRNVIKKLYLRMTGRRAS